MLFFWIIVSKISDSLANVTYIASFPTIAEISSSVDIFYMIIWFIELTLCSYLNFLNIAQQVPIKISKVIKAVPAKGILFAISKPAEAALTNTFEAKCAILSIYVYYLVFNALLEG